MEIKPLILGSLFCFVLGLLLIGWTQQFIQPEQASICDIQSNRVVLIKGTYQKGVIINNCTVKVRFYGQRPDNGDNIMATGEKDGPEFVVIGWESVN